MTRQAPHDLAHDPSQPTTHPPDGAGVDHPFARLVEVARTGSTSSDLVAAVQAEGDDGEHAWPHLSALRTDHQDAGRGRAGRVWETPPGSSATFSVVLRPRRPRAEWPTLALVAGLAVVTAVAELLRVDADAVDTGRGAGTAVVPALKWPNDVVLRPAGGVEIEDVPGWGDSRKLAGLLAEAVPGRDAVVLGIGVNVTQDRASLAVPWATSLALAGTDVTAREVTLAVGRALVALVGEWDDGGFAALHPRVAAVTDTLGREVAVDLGLGDGAGGGATLTGSAVALAPDGRLLVRTPDGATHAVAAGDVTRARRR
ncbi:biotin--[acetyl-CoA-carboxylase] ligase [Litorihabitans aurantiacus]|uniref:biotin--[biotin carboxyl-carrier protein] ligase n=1 Tax=Litorihabitans aurantiacus TaxID=1930061 RepID=A0AA37UU74_9MICO|nr:biotin--[acetyl-CoA-carboxylase] ligase [Litorihabitans aurantiacus]GMA30597.1 biotin--[acetyl-CoA-carboxylase] ligase [Litorihabitans aurantiacus]